MDIEGSQRGISRGSETGLTSFILLTFLCGGLRGYCVLSIPDNNFHN